MGSNFIYFLMILFVLYSCKKEEKSHNIVSNNTYDKAWDLMQSNESDSAFYYFNVAKQEFIEDGDQLGAGKALMNSAIIQADGGDYFGSEESCILALKYLYEAKDTEYLVSTYNAIAISRKNLKDFRTALNWYEKAFQTSKDSLEKVAISSNIAVANTKLGEYNTSIKIFENLLNSRISDKNQKIKAKIVDNLAFTKFLQSKNYNAEPELDEALKIRVNEEDLWGQNASHAHLADYFAEKNPEKSLVHAHKMYELAKKLKSPDDQIEALQKLVNLENTANSKRYFRKYLLLNDSLQTARNKAKNQYALIRYDTEKNRADFLKSEARIIEKSYQLLQRNIALAIALIAMILGVFWYKKRKLRLQQEKELEVKNTELKFSKKIHDVVSNGVYQVMSEIENTNTIDKGKILNKLENLYEKSRDISYENTAENAAHNFKSTIYNLVNSFQSEVLKPVIIGNEEDLWWQVSPKVKEEIVIILQELLVNMKKHSKAKKMKLLFEKTDNQLDIIYTDDGIGFGKNILKKNGLQNTETRIFSCNGTLKFDQTIEKGTKIEISFPLKNA